MKKYYFVHALLNIFLTKRVYNETKVHVCEICLCIAALKYLVCGSFVWQPLALKKYIPVPSAFPWPTRGSIGTRMGHTLRQPFSPMIDN